MFSLVFVYNPIGNVETASNQRSSFAIKQPHQSADFFLFFLYSIGIFRQIPSRGAKKTSTRFEMLMGR
jgi:hypothetical protein